MHWDDIHQAVKALTGRAKVAKDVAEAAGRIFDRAPFTVPIDFEPRPFSVDAYYKAADRYFREPLSAGRYITRRERPKLSFSDLIPEGQTPGDLMMSGTPLTLAELAVFNETSRRVCEMRKSLAGRLAEQVRGVG